MCGRYSLELRPDFADRFMVSSVPQNVMSHYNIAPSQELPVIVRNSPNSVQLMTWGLIPAWSKDGKSSVINARSETLNEKPMFKHLLTKQRCLVPATGFYEWRKTKEGKMPYYFRLKNNEMFAFAGIYGLWKDQTGKEIYSYTIITTAANDIMRPIHDRMPVILEREDEEAWLDKGTMISNLSITFFPYPAEKMTYYPVSILINNPEVDNELLTKQVGGTA